MEVQNCQVLTTQNSHYLPLEACFSQFNKWNCDIQLRTHNNVYYKCLEGYGQIEFANGAKYEGQIKNGLLHGKGSFYWPSQVQYHGDFVQSKICGMGTFKWSNGNIYEGQVLNGQKQGKGIFYCFSQGYTYNGFWKSGIKEGQGKIQYRDQSIYEGSFLSNKKNGYGKMVYESKNQYEGQWLDDKKHGKGTMTWLNPHEKYVGNWKNDVFDSYGEYYWYDNKIQFKILKNVYKGNWKNGKRQGFGSFLYSNGCRFEGFFQNNSKQGLGIVIDENGTPKVETYSNNRPISLISKQFTSKIKTKTTASEDQKLPKVVTKKTIAKTEKQYFKFQQSISKCSNQYKKYIDFNHKEFDDNFYNMLLRNNSQLRNLYRFFSISTPQYKDFYSGMVLQNYWKALKECRLLSDQVSTVAIDRQFSKGARSYFNLDLPQQSVINCIKEESLELDKIGYQNILWQSYIQKVSNLDFTWKQFRFESIECNIDIPKYSSFDIHNPSNVILFRNFVCLIVHTAILLDHSQKPLKQKVENFISLFFHLNQSSAIKSEKFHDNLTQLSNKHINIPQWAKKFHEDLVNQIMQVSKSGDKIDSTLSIRQLISVLEMGNLFKDTNEKLVYLQKIQKCLNIKANLLKRQSRTSMGTLNELEKSFKSSSHYLRTMNYELTPTELHEFLFLCFSRKFVSNNHEDMKMKYKEGISTIVKIIKKNKQDNSPPQMTIKGKHLQSKKDIAKIQMLKLHEKMRLEQLVKRRIEQEEARQAKERRLMFKEDRNVEDSGLMSEKSYSFLA